MRLAILLIGIGVSLGFTFQSSFGVGIGTIGAAFGSEELDAIATTGVGGMITAFFGFVASALVFASGFASAVGFALAGLLAQSMRAEFPDAGVWGTLYYVLAGVSFLIGVQRARAGRKRRAARAARQA